MVDSRTEQHAFTLRAIGERLRLEPVKKIITAPGLCAVYRVTIYYHDRRALDSVATVCEPLGGDPELTIYYRGAFGEQPIKHMIPRSRYEGFTGSLQQLRFDHLKDQPGMPQHGLDFWMVERAAANFVHSVIVAPETAEEVHAELVNAIKTYLPEAVRYVAQGY